MRLSILQLSTRREHKESSANQKFGSGNDSTLNKFDKTIQTRPLGPPFFFTSGATQDAEVDDIILLLLVKDIDDIVF